MGINKLDKRPLLIDDRSRLANIVHSTASSTGLNPAGVYGFSATSTSTSAPTRWILGAPNPGDVFECSVVDLVSTAEGVAVVASSGMTFDGANDQMQMLVDGAGFRAIALSTSRWLVTAVNSASFTTST